jgi:predicted acetyltransferase
MLKLVARDEIFIDGYKQYCQEFYDHKIDTFIPMKPEKVTKNWFRNTLDFYLRREQGLIEEQPKSICLWAVDHTKFIGEFQLRPELNERIKNTIGSIGYSVRITEQGKGYGKLILGEGLKYARKIGMKKLILLIDESNKPSRKLCESFGGVYYDTILVELDNGSLGKVCRYWIYL